MTLMQVERCQVCHYRMNPRPARTAFDWYNWRVLGPCSLRSVDVSVTVLSGPKP